MNVTPPHLLIIDDDDDHLELMKVCMETFGYHITTQNDAVKAVNFLRSSESKVDLVLVDYRMPGQDGMETLRQIIGLDPDLPVIMLTALVTANLATAFLKGGGSDYLIKPVQDFEVVDLRVKKSLAAAKLQKEMKQTERMFRNIIGNVASGIITLNKDSEIMFINPAAETMMGYEQGELVGENVSILMSSEAASKHDDQLKTHFAGKSKRSVIGRKRELLARTKRGGDIYIELLVTEMCCQDGAVLLGSFTDITSRKAAEDHVVMAEIARQAAEKASQAKSAFLANMSHELRTPLTSIIGYADILAEEVSEHEQSIQTYVERISSSADHQLQVVNDILDLAKIEEGKVAYHFHDASLSGLVGDVVDNMLSVASTRNLTISLQDGIGGNDTTRCDDNYIGRVVWNLLGNAIKFADRGSEIVVTLESDQEFFICSVADEGADIPKQELEMIFEPFTQSSSTDDGAGGTGLGLALCKKIISDHKGRIWVERRVDPTGAIFKFSVPK